MRQAPPAATFFARALLSVALPSVALLALLLLAFGATSADAQSRTRRPSRTSTRARIAALEAELSTAQQRADAAEASAAEARARADAATASARDAEARAAQAEQRATAAEAAARDANARANRAEARQPRGRGGARVSSDAAPAVDIAESGGVGADTPSSTDELALPRGRALANLSEALCLAQLRASGVRFDSLAEQDAPGVRTPVRLRGPLGGVTIAPRNDPERSPHAILDCRLALALLAWAPTLRAAHITQIEHYSAFREGARVAGSASGSGSAVSGHASGMALDAALFHTDDGEVLDVLVDWADRTRGAAPCAPRDTEPARAQTLRGVVCEAVRAELFQVVLTPHHDAAHRNHVHLELRPGVDWSFIR